MNELKQFRTAVEERLADELAGSKKKVQIVRISEKDTIYVYETTAYIDEQLYRGVGESVGKAIDDLLNEFHYEKNYHENHDRVKM
jgi:hypothetical protein